MKTLQEYIDKEFVKNRFPSSYRIYHEQQTIINDFFCEDIPENLKNDFEQNNTLRSTDFIVEFLKSVSDDFIIKQLNKIDNKIFIQKCDDELFKNDKEKYFCLLSDYDITKDERFVTTIEKFGYHISDIEEEPFGFVFFIEPNYTENMSQYIQEKFHGVVYHITNKKNVESILKNGLRCKNTWGAQKLYLFASLSIKKDSEKIVKMINIDFSKCAIMKINLPEFVSVYKDTKMSKNNCFYTYITIPPRYITCITK